MNATTRVPFERTWRWCWRSFRRALPILMARVGPHRRACKIAGIPLQQTINESDWDSWHAALEDPAGHAAYVLAFEGDALQRQSPRIRRVWRCYRSPCGTGQPCARIYQSNRYGTHAGAASK